MKFDVDDKNRCRLVCVKFHLNRYRFAVAVAKCLGGLTFFGTQCRMYIEHKCCCFDVWCRSSSKGAEACEIRQLCFTLLINVHTVSL